MTSAPNASGVRTLTLGPMLGGSDLAGGALFEIRYIPESIYGEMQNGGGTGAMIGLGRAVRSYLEARGSLEPLAFMPELEL